MREKAKHKSNMKDNKITLSKNKFVKYKIKKDEKNFPTEKNKPQVASRQEQSVERAVAHKSEATTNRKNYDLSKAISNKGENKNFYETKINEKHNTQTKDAELKARKDSELLEKTMKGFAINQAILKYKQAHLSPKMSARFQTASQNTILRSSSESNKEKENVKNAGVIIKTITFCHGELAISKKHITPSEMTGIQEKYGDITNKKAKATIHYKKMLCYSQKESQLEKRIGKKEKTTERNEKIIKTIESGTALINSPTQFAKDTIKEQLQKNKVMNATLNAAADIKTIDDASKANSMAEGVSNSLYALPEKYVKNAARSKAKNIITGRNATNKLKKDKAQYGRKAKQQERKARQAKAKQEDKRRLLASQIYQKANKKKSSKMVSFFDMAVSALTKGNPNVYIAIAVVILLLLLILMIVIIFAETHPFIEDYEYRLVTATTGDYDLDGELMQPLTATEDEHLDVYLAMIQNYLNFEQYIIWTKYGNFEGDTYAWKDAEDFVTFDDLLKIKIEEARAEVIEQFKGGPASNSPEDMAAYQQAYNEAMGKALEKAEEDATEIYKATCKELNYYYGYPTYHTFKPMQDDDYNWDQPQWGIDELLDSTQYNAYHIGGLNRCDIPSLNIRGELPVCEDILPYLLLAKYIRHTGNVAQDIDDEYFISQAEVNEFMLNINIIEHNLTVETNVKCNGTCCRTAVGNWRDGWRWEYYCGAGTTIAPHIGVSGGITNIKSEDEIFNAVIKYYLDPYINPTDPDDAVDIELTKADCREMLNEYVEYVKTEYLSKQDHFFQGHLWGAYVDNADETDKHPLYAVKAYQDLYICPRYTLISRAKILNTDVWEYYL